MSSVIFNSDIQNNYDNCEDFAEFVDECVEEYIMSGKEESCAYYIPEYITENVEEYDDCCVLNEIEITTEANGDLNVHYND